MSPKDRFFASLELLSGACARWRSEGETVVLTSGCFDVVHGAHGLYVHRAGLLGRLVVGLNSDAFVRRLKGPDRPFRPEVDRALLMACFANVEGVVVFDDDLALIRAVRPHIYVVSGPSHVLVEDDAPRLALLRELGVEIRQIESHDVSCSSTELIGKARRSPLRAGSTPTEGVQLAKTG